MTVTVPQRLARDTATIAAATRVRWTYIAPTLLVFWIVSMFDKSNIALVIADPKFLDELQARRPAQIAWLAGGQSVHLLQPGRADLGLGGDQIRPASRHYGDVCHLGADLLLVGPFEQLRHVARLAHRPGHRRSGLLPGDAGAGRQLVRAARERGTATSYWWIGTMIGPMLTGLIVTSLIVMAGWRGQFYALGILALILPLPMVWFLVRDKPEQHPAVNAAEADLIEAGAIEKNDDAPGRILKTSAASGRATLLADDECHLRQ